MSKRMRQQAIVEIVSRTRIQNQSILADELKKRSFEVTQATLSRDIAELNLVKSKSGYTRPQDANGVIFVIPDPLGTLKRNITKAEIAGAMLVLKTTTGGAAPVAVALDNGLFEETVGTIAGDDTIFIATKSSDEAFALRNRIIDIIG